jgi:RNA polymerase primary sigma factor
MNETGSGDVLTTEEEQSLGRRIQQGDNSALNALVVANMRFAMYIANRYRQDSVDIDDLIQEANIGLLLAARHYDPERGVRFTSYAVWQIESQLRRYLSRHASVIRVGEGARQVARRLRRAEEKLLQEHPHVTLEMVAREADIDLATAELAMAGAFATPLSLDRLWGDADREFTLQDMVADDSSEQAFTQTEVETVLGPLLEDLDSRQRHILEMRYAENRSSNEIGQQIGLSGARVRQIEAQAIRYLRRRLMTHRQVFGHIDGSTSAA